METLQMTPAATQPHFLLTTSDAPCACELCGGPVGQAEQVLLVPAWRTMLPVCLTCSRKNRWVVDYPKAQWEQACQMADQLARATGRAHFVTAGPHCLMTRSEDRLSQAERDAAQYASFPAGPRLA